MKIILDDDNMSTFELFTVDVLNDAPVFTVPVLESYRMHINKTLEVSVLNFSDTESHKVYMSFKYQKVILPDPLPGWAA
jgi:hypothetical protein